jgi:hypothetical protein
LRTAFLTMAGESNDPRGLARCRVAVGRPAPRGEFNKLETPDNMNATITRRLEAMDRSRQFILDHPFTPPVTRADVLVTNITTAATTLRERGSEQALGRLSFRAGVDERAALANDLRLAMRDINETASKLDRAQFPGVRMLFRMPNSNGFQALINAARAFVEAVVPIKTAFVDRGFPAAFVEALVLRIDTVEAAVLRKYRGLQLQRAGTVELELVARAGMAAVRELGSIVRCRYRVANPSLYEAWKSASRPQSAPRATEELADESSATATTPTPIVTS